ncbi:putative heparinase superfamily protein [Nitrobacteraceae bacterium AZCC 1564]
MTAHIVNRFKRLASKPPSYVVRRLTQEARMQSERFVAPAFARLISGHRLARWAGASSIDDLWEKLASMPYPARSELVDRLDYDRAFPGSAETIFAAAERALKHELDLLGTGPIQMGPHIDWLQDYKTGDRWPVQFCKAIDYVNKGRPSDVKIPWEISRLQWLLPVGQAYLLSEGDERYAQGARSALESWIESNPYAYSVNWSCTMEAALRLQSWTWLFHVFARSAAWSDRKFRDKFLTSLYLHGTFTEVHIERSTINGNHLTADAVGLVFAGLFFREIGAADRWEREGWRTLNEEIAKQIHPDGVDFEASVPYHRLVAELFTMAARYRVAAGLAVDSAYADRLAAMARFAESYSRPDGTSPHWGDADDGRSLPLGTQALDDHRYLPGLIANTIGRANWAGTYGDELFWHSVPDSGQVKDVPMVSARFDAGGVFILADANNQVFVDCGPVGLAGLGGHGHNDALSFEAWLRGVPVVIDPGSYVYTADFAARNHFRSTSMHNTVQVDGEQINRLYAPDNLWNLHDDAQARLLDFVTDSARSCFSGEHSGYRRLADPVGIRRNITLDHSSGALSIEDLIDAKGAHALRVPIHLSSDARVGREDDRYIITVRDRRFALSWEGPAWQLSIEESSVSLSYGIRVPAQELVWKTRSSGSERLKVIIQPI